MALPPIISNLPFMKLFKARPAEGAGTERASAAASPGGHAPRDTLDISAAAPRQGVSSLRLSVPESDGDARLLASQARELLSGGQMVLGLDPRFG